MTIATRQIEDDVLDVLNRSVIATGGTYDDTVRLPDQLPRDLYVKVNKVLESHGGKWNRKQKAHVFPPGGTDVFVQSLINREYVDDKLNGYFPTPASLADEVIRLAEIRHAMDVLEPSAGRGVLAYRAAIKCGNPRDVYVCELLPDNAYLLREEFCFQWLGEDFLKVEPRPFPRIVMNPPFGKNAAPKHLEHALRFLAPGGKLVAIMPNGFQTATTKTVISIYDTLNRTGNYMVLPNPEGSFREVGTDVRTCTLVFTKMEEN